MWEGAEHAEHVELWMMHCQIVSITVLCCNCVMLYAASWILSGATKFGLLCELYTRNKKEMSKPERQEALDYLRGRYGLYIALD